MNLCGGIVNTAEVEMLMPAVLATVPSVDDGILTYPSRRDSDAHRRRKSDGVKSSGRPSSRSRSRQKSSGPGGRQSSHGLNPLSKEDLKKSRSRSRQRQRVASQNNSKLNATILKKLESGLRLVWHATENETGKNVTMELSSDKSHLRVRELEPDDFDPEEINLTTDLIKIRLNDIVRVEVGKSRSSKESIPSSALSVPSTNYFSISTSNKEGDTSTYGFETGSITDRDGLISVVKMLFEQAKTDSIAKRVGNTTQEESEKSLNESPDSSSPRKNVSQTPTMHAQQQKVQVQRHSVGPNEEGTEASLVGFDFNPANYGSDESSEEIETSMNAKKRVSTLNEDTITAMLPITPIASKIQHHRTNVDHAEPTNSSDDDTRDISSTGTDEEDLRDRNSSSEGEACELRLAADQDTESDTEGRELSVTIHESSSLKNESVEVTGSEWSGSGEWGSSKSEKTKRTNDKHSKDKGNNSVAIIARRPHIMADVEEFELMAIANQMGTPWCTDDICASAFANQMAEPWCTDDICTAALKDVAETCKGIFDIKQQSKSGEKSRNGGQQELFEDYIAGVLGAPSAMASMLSVGDVFNSAGLTPPKPESTQSEINRIQNRACVPNAQALRLKNLRSEMTFEAAQRQNRERLYFVQTVTSVDDIEIARRRRKEKFSVPPETDFGTQFDSAALLQQVVGNVIPNANSTEEDEILYYDSDPESSRVRTHSRGPRRVHADRLNAIENATRNRRRTLSGIPINRLATGKRWKKMDESLVTEIIEAMKNEKLVLMWHPTQTKQSPNRSPVCVKVWIESGVYLLDGTFLLPKLTWVRLHEGHLHSKIVNVSKQSPEKLDLLDVCRVRECETVDRQLHPFARSDRSFVIQTQSEAYLFEAQSREERSRIVNGLKLVIARLASLLMLRDLRAVDEFFGGGSVPGEAPAWATGSNNSTNNPSGPPPPE